MQHHVFPTRKRKKKKEKLTSLERERKRERAFQSIYQLEGFVDRVCCP